MQALSSLCCQNKKCRDYGKRKAKNLSVCGWYGINNHLRMLYCRTCKSRFPEINTSSKNRNFLEGRKLILEFGNNSRIFNILAARESAS